MTIAEVALFTLLRPQALEVQCGPGGVQKTITQAASFQGTCRLMVEGAPARTFRGEFAVTRVNGALRVVLKADVEDLTAAIVSAESPPGASVAMLEAQAIVTRTWLLASGKRHREFSFCDTTHCQHFKEATERGTRASRSTAGLVLSWQGKPFPPAYSASCGGRTMTAKEIGWRDDNRYPYFAVECEVCQRAEQQWTRTFTGDLARFLAGAPNRESTRLTIGRDKGWDRLPSNHYKLSGDGNSLTAIGRGQGHGLGLCQRGAAGFSSASAILAHYFPGTSVTATR